MWIVIWVLYSEVTVKMVLHFPTKGSHCNLAVHVLNLTQGRGCHWRQGVSVIFLGPSTQISGRYPNQAKTGSIHIYWSHSILITLFDRTAFTVTGWFGRIWKYCAYKWPYSRLETFNTEGFGTGIAGIRPRTHIHQLKCNVSYSIPFVIVLRKLAGINKI